MSVPPRKASTSVRLAIVEALADPRRVVLDHNGPSRRFLEFWDLPLEIFREDLKEALGSDHLFLKPKTFPNQLQRYQCVVFYPEENGYEAILVHVTLAPRGKPPKVLIAVHPSDTAQTLPAIIIPNP